MLQEIFEYPFLIRILDKIFVDKEKIILISLNKFFNSKRTKFTFQKTIKITEEDKNKWFYDCLTNIKASQILKFPKSITHLKLSHCFNENIEGCIPNSVTHLTFGYYFNQTVKDGIPSSVTHLTFGMNFNKNIEGCIPNSVTHLTFGFDFNQNIKNCIPSSVTHLTFGTHFNKNIEGCIPNSVTHLTFGYYFNKSIKNCIPNSITHLTFEFDFNQEIEGNIPDTLISLTIWNRDFNKKILKFPISLKHLTCHKLFYNINKHLIPKNVVVNIIKY